MTQTPQNPEDRCAREGCRHTRDVHVDDGESAWCSVCGSRCPGFIEPPHGVEPEPERESDRLYERLLRGEATSAEYARVLRREVREARKAAPPSTGERGECPMCGAPLDGPAACIGQHGDGEPIYCRNPPHQHRGRAEGQTHDESVDAARHGHLPDPGPPLDFASPEVEPQEQEGRPDNRRWTITNITTADMRVRNVTGPECQDEQVAPASALAKAEAALAQTREENARLHKFVYGPAPEWERANATLKHQVRELESEKSAAEERERGLREALERLYANCQYIFAKQPVRDWDETLAEVRSALQASSPSAGGETDD